MRVRRNKYHGHLPGNFFGIPELVYKHELWKPEEDESVVRELFEIEAEGQEIICYTDDEGFRLVGMFPFDSDEAFFGFWETVDNVSLNKEGFSLLVDDALSRGKKLIKGPINFNTFHNYRLRVTENQHHFDREPFNPRYYVSIIRQLGFTTTDRFESRYVKKEDVEFYYQNKDRFLKRLDSIPFGFVPLNRQNWRFFKDDIFSFVKDTFRLNPSFKSIPQREFELIYNESFADRLCPLTSVLFVDKNTSKIAALSFCQPNYTSLNLPGKNLSFEQHFASLKQKTLLIKTVGVHPEYRRQNLMSYIGAYAMKSFREHYQEAIFCLMRSKNVSTNFTRGLPYEKTVYELFEMRL